MSNVLVTGVNGFVGKHLVRELATRGHAVYGLALNEPAAAEISQLLAGYYICDVTQANEVAKLPLDKIDAVISLAGLANVRASFDNPEMYKSVNVEVLTVLAERLLSLGSKARVIAVSSGALYDPGQPLPLTEESKLDPESSPYAVSKILMEDAARDLRSRGLDTVIVRPFNHIGPGQGPGFLLPDLYAGISEARETGAPLRVGDLSTRRDYTDVRDIVKGYANLAEAKTLQFDTYNLCSGTSRPGQEILDTLLKTMPGRAVQIEVDQSRIRPTDPSELRGSHDRLTAETGWQPVMQLEQTVRDFVAAA